jgi:hypothetical protein
MGCRCPFKTLGRGHGYLLVIRTVWLELNVVGKRSDRIAKGTG